MVKKARRFALIAVGAAATLYISFGAGPIPFYLVRNLEYQYAPLKTFEGLTNVNTVVVLAGHAVKDPNLPITSGVNSTSVFRLVEAIRIVRNLPETKILISGWGTVPQVMKKVLVSLGIPPGRVFLENQSRNTYQSAQNLDKLLEHKPFILVTSAVHMPRSVGVFRQQGMNPIPAPCNYLIHKSNPNINYLPSPSHLIFSDTAAYEYLGILWYRLTDFIA